MPEPKKPNPLTSLKQRKPLPQQQQRPILTPKKVKPTKEAMSRPITTPSGHPNVKKRPFEEEDTRNVKKTRPITTPSAHSNVKKRSFEEEDTRNVKKTRPNSEGDLITEEEVIAVLRGKRLTTKEFLLHFRKRIKKNEQNRGIVTSLLKKVARHITTEGSDVRLLELNPEYQ